jgi:hypothetical protein
MYEQDAKGHLERHGIEGVNGNWRTYFVKGRKEQPGRPGARYSPIYRKTKKAERTEPRALN